ncbi:MAG: hypothetical protein VB859_15330, partial [Planctomycetaceae bacterium]
NGGIAGLVYYGVTRAEDGPDLAAGEPWEPGVPRVQLTLFEDKDFDGVIDDNDGQPDNTGLPATNPLTGEDDPDVAGNVTQADVDHYPLSFDEDTGTWDPGPEDLNYGPTTGAGNQLFDMGDAIRVAWSDAFDDNQPTGGQGNELAFNHMGTDRDCYDGLRMFNQTRPGVFDGGWLFDNLPPQGYIVQCAIPPGYQINQQEDKNVDFGDTYCLADSPDCSVEPDGFPIPGSDIEAVADRMGTDTPGWVPDGGFLGVNPAAANILAVVGRPHLVDPYLTLFPEEMIDSPQAGEVVQGTERWQIDL